MEQLARPTIQAMQARETTYTLADLATVFAETEARQQFIATETTSTDNTPEDLSWMADGQSCDVHGRLRPSENYGLRLDAEFECANCETPLIVEDAGDGVFGRIPECDTSRFEGRGYRA
jgi:hypothetical protein